MHRQGDEAKKSDANRTGRGVNETDPRSFGNNDPHDRSSKYPRKKNLRIEMSNRGGPTRESENIDTTAIATNAQWMMMNPNQLNQLAQTSNQMTPVNPMNTHFYRHQRPMDDDEPKPTQSTSSNRQSDDTSESNEHSQSNEPNGS
eukprot:CAMPEP_0115038724 /NCGR_PEP_ID=MMETSP0216-20121206/43588_1 /TAXON_ID=223996 /ORGANISM="Protocruzia adherens, Strain Boccale" /LENGTH=144 /DNA_ID=CAMNT_0002419197 /DNA_START=674 /DNA_END=1105 /DNA_ORIENTATION=+